MACDTKLNHKNNFIKEEKKTPVDEILKEATKVIKETDVLIKEVGKEKKVVKYKRKSKK